MVHTVIGLILFVYLFVRLIPPLLKRKVPAAVLTVLLAAGAFKFACVRLLGGKYFFCPELPGWILAVSCGLFVWVLLAALLTLVSEPFRLGVWLYRKKRRLPEMSRKQVCIINGVLLGAAGLLAAVSVLEGAAMPQVRKIELAFAGLPAEADSLKIAVLSDIHVQYLIRQKEVREIVRRTQKTEPDVIVLLGDLADGLPEARALDIAPLAELHAPLGVWAVPGNHEYYYHYDEWRKMYTQTGLHLLENTSVTLQKPRIRLAGVTDRAALRFLQEGPDLDSALADGTEKELFTVLLAHRPDLAPQAAAKGVKLQLSGHTHGGMLPILKQLVARFNGGFVEGLYQTGGMTLFVSRGTGIWNGFPVRLLTPPEITVIQLRKLP